MEHIFGPVPSRRLGSSLGIDVVPFKTCTFDCVYCECGRTTNKTCSRTAFFPMETILDELEARLGEIPEKPAVLTLSGAGEPTLYEPMGELIAIMKRRFGLPVAVITNSSLVGSADVREELMEADILLPSLDTAIEETFQRINQPHENCRLERIIGGLESLLGRFRGTVLFEILLVDGFNTDTANIDALKKVLRRIRTDRIQLNTAVRPGTEKGIIPLDPISLKQIRYAFGPRCEIVAGTHAARLSREGDAIEEKILSLVGRRPCTAEDIHRSLGLPAPAVVKLIDMLEGAGMVVSERHGGDTFFTAAQRNR
ncbi:MAG: radical SAM protein [bacterium]|nr:MAG: radical SAM protein [bacterium]